MIELDLTEQERVTLADVLEGCLSDLRMEISDTENKDYREMLKSRKQTLLKVLTTLTTEENNRASQS
jgi:hypothetical protein